MPLVQEPFEFVRVTFRQGGGREYTYKAVPGALAVGDEAITSPGKTVYVTAVLPGIAENGAVVNGKPLGANSYGWLAKKPPTEEVLRSGITTT